MKIKSMVAAAAMALSALCANAQVTTPAVEVNGTFNDVLLGSVSVPGASNVGGGLGYMLTFTFFGTVFDLPAVTFSSVALGGQNASLGANNTFSFTVAGPGSYDLTASGSVANGGRNYIGAQYTITAVPEPETVAMLLAGLGLIGTIGRRRSIAAANA